MGRGELALRDDTWAELVQRGATPATVPFSGRASAGGRVAAIRLSRVDGGELLNVERSNERAYAPRDCRLNRFGRFAGQPWVRGSVTRVLEDRRVLIVGDRGGVRFEEAVA